MVYWVANNPIFAAGVTMVLMWVDWLLTILQERERQNHYGEHYQSYPVNTIEGNPLMQSRVPARRLFEPRHLIFALVAGAGVAVALTTMSGPWRIPFLGYVWGIFLIVSTTHLGNLIGYVACRPGYPRQALAAPAHRFLHPGWPLRGTRCLSLVSRGLFAITVCLGHRGRRHDIGAQAVYLVAQDPGDWSG